MNYDPQYEEWAIAVFRDTDAYYLYRFPWMFKSPDETDMQDT